MDTLPGVGEIDSAEADWEKMVNISWKKIAEKLAKAVQEGFEDSGYCQACDCHTHADDCPVLIVIPEANDF